MPFASRNCKQYSGSMDGGPFLFESKSGKSRDYSPASARKRGLLYGASQAGPTRRSRKTRACGEEIVDSFETASELVAALAGEFSIVQACIKIEIRMHNHNTAPDTDPVRNVGRARLRLAPPPAELLSFRTHDHTHAFRRPVGWGKDHVFGRTLILESCRRSADVNFHLWLWAASSTNVRCRPFRAARTISVSSKSLILRRIGTWKLMGARSI
jgi:hypothetical protein